MARSTSEVMTRLELELPLLNPQFGKPLENKIHYYAFKFSVQNWIKMYLLDFSLCTDLISLSTFGQTLASYTPEALPLAYFTNY